MTDTPPQNQPDPAPETEPLIEAEKVKRTLRQAIIFFGGIGLIVLLVVAIVTSIGGRTYLVSDPGRELISGFINGKQISRYGRINTEGLRGDLFDDFTLDRVTITDSEGVWLEARNVRVNWSFIPLIARRFHAEEISADQIRLIRRPVLDPPKEPGGPQALSVQIDSIKANVELLEDFSKDYGRWNLTGDLRLPRKGDKAINVNANSLSRPGDFLRLKAKLGKEIQDLRLDLNANEANGGPLAGALGYSPDKPFTAVGLINGETVDITMRTGQFTPLHVKGHFGDKGSRLSGYADFSGSDLFAPFINKVGRTARFGLALVPDKDRENHQGLAWRLLADNLDTRGLGMVNTKDRVSEDGIKFELNSPSLSRLIGSPLAEGTNLSGTLKGGTDRWTIDGNASLLNADIASYRATRISGPLTLSAQGGVYALTGDIRATGGSSAGIIGSLLGSSPRIQLEAQRNKDGGILLKSIDARGQGLTLTGSGSRNLLGGLSFNGNASLTDLSRIKAGAEGSFSGPIRASSAKPGAPWVLNFDGRGKRMAIGMEELDRLLGQTPRLQMSGSFNDGNIAIQRGELTGAVARMGAKGLIEGSRLRLALDWNASGPFLVGPAAIDGAMSGSGALTGTLAQPVADLRAKFDKVAASGLVLNDADLTLSFRKGADGSNGRIALLSGSNYGPARASGNFYLGNKLIRLTDVDLDAGGVTAKGAIALSNSFPSSADLTFNARQGAFLASGQANGRIRLLDGGGSESAILDVTGRNVRLAGSTWSIRNLNLQGRGSLDNLPFTLAADVGGPNPVQFNGTGLYARQPQGHTVTLRGGGRVREVAFTTRTPAVVALTNDGRVVRLDLGVGGGILTGELRQDSKASFIKADLTNVELGSIAPDLRGQVTGNVLLEGQGDSLTGNANVRLNQIRSLDAPRGMAVNGNIRALLNGDTLTLDATAQDSSNVRASANVSLPVEASAAPLRLAIARTRPLSGQVQIAGQIQPIWDLFLGGSQTLAGQVNANATLGGTLNAPNLSGQFNMAQGSFRDSASGLRLESVNLNSRFNNTAAEISLFNATDGQRGTVTGNGRIGLTEGSTSNLELTLARFMIIDSDIAKVRANGTLNAVRGTDGNIQLGGNLDIDDAEISPNLPGSNGIVRMDVVEINRPGGDQVITPTERKKGPAIGLNLNLTGREINIRGRGLDVELRANARVRGTLAAPQLSGTANVVRGDYEFSGKRFVFSDTGTVSLSTDPSRIRLNLEAVREDPALTATIRVTGTAAKPEIALTSSPELPQDEILSNVLFGRSASQLSALEAAQLAAAVASLAGGGGFDVVGNLRELAGLDRLSFGGEASGMTVAGGRYITDDIYLEVIGGGEGGAAVKVEWQVRRNLAISSRFGGDNGATLSVRWRRESDRPGPNRDRFRQRQNR